MEKANNQSDTAFKNLANLKRLAYFTAVVETGSFTVAAERLGITKAVVSQQVARLEREFRASLLTRTTRSVKPTPAGQAFYERCARILHEAGDAFSELAEVASEPAGTLRLTAPFDYGVSVVVPTIAAFIERYPQCKVDAVLNDQTLDLMSSDFELAIRAGRLTESNLQARQIGSFNQLLVAAPSWRKRTARLDGPEDVASLPFVANTALRSSLRWQFSRFGNDARGVNMTASVFLDATLAVKEAVCQGMGLSVLPDFAIVDELATGRLIHVLPEWSLPSGGMHAVFPAARFRPIKVRAFVELLEERQREFARSNATSSPAPGKTRTKA